jgi:4-hydroxybenzoate polyprenyltransferase
MIQAKKAASFVKIEHSLFSVPMLFAGALLVPGTKIFSLPWMKLLWIVLAGTGARTLALALNRLIDRKLDAKNPRTLGRELVTGALSPVQAWAIALTGAALYFWAVSQLGDFCLRLSPIPAAVFILYPLMKRFTWASHFGVGAGLALAPLGAYVGLAGSLPESSAPWWLAGFTLCWVSGFDVLYATLDEAFDRKEGLYSIPSKFGSLVAQDVGLVLHGLALLCLAALRWRAFSDSSAWIWLALAPAAVLLFLEQRYGYSLEQNSPFFKVNAWIGVAVLFYVLAGLI